MIVLVIVLHIVGTILLSTRKTYQPRSNILKQFTLVDTTEVVKTPVTFAKIDERNSRIKTFACESVDVRFKENGAKYRVRGVMYYEKEKNFRFIVKSILGKETDIGSNKDIFWYWSRRMDNGTLFYASHENYYKTRLKPQFNPIWMMDSLGISKLDFRDAKIVENANKYIIVRNTKNTIGQPIVKFTYIDKKTETIDGSIVMDKDGKPIAAAEVLLYKNYLPVQILYTWFEVDRSMLIDLNNPQANIRIDGTNWVIPDIQPKMDIGK